MRQVLSWSGDRFGLATWCGGWGRRNRLVRLAAINLLVGAAKRAEPLEGLDQPEREAGLLAPGALAHDAIRAALGQRSGSFGYGFVAHASRVFSSGSRRSSAGHRSGARKLPPVHSIHI